MKCYSFNSFILKGHCLQTTYPLIWIGKTSINWSAEQQTVCHLMITVIIFLISVMEWASTKCQSLCQSVSFGQGGTRGNGITRFQLGVDSKGTETVLVDKRQMQHQEMMAMACITLILFAPKSLFSLVIS